MSRSAWGNLRVMANEQTSVVYVGPHTEGVEVPWRGAVIIAGRGVPVDVPAELAESLLEQATNWQPATKTKAAAPAAKAKE